MWGGEGVERKYCYFVFGQETEFECCLDIGGSGMCIRDRFGEREYLIFGPGGGAATAL